MKKNQSVVFFLLCFLAGLAGGALHHFIEPREAFAQNRTRTVQAEELRLSDSRGQTMGRWPGDRKYNGLFFFDDNSRTSRLEIGLFPDGRPVLALNDEKHLCKFLLKLEWDKNIPMLFMKEPADRNRLIMSLDLKKSDLPVLVLFDKQGRQNEVFGKFDMP